MNIYQQEIPAAQQTDFNTYTTYKPYIHKGYWMATEEVCQWLRLNQRGGSAQMIEGNYTPKHQDEYGKLYVNVSTLLELIERETVIQMQCDVITLCCFQD